MKIKPVWIGVGALALLFFTDMGQKVGDLFGLSLRPPPPPAGPVSPPASGQGSLSNQGGNAGNTPVVYAQAAQGFASAAKDFSSAMTSIYDAMAGSSSVAPADAVYDASARPNAGAGAGSSWVGFA